MKKYALKKTVPEEIDKALGSYSQITKKLLSGRGIDTKEKAEIFFNPDYDLHSHDPKLLSDGEKAVERILKAIEKKEKIVVYSDYDHDGIPGGVIFHDFFKKIGYENFVNYIPHRHDEGFGLNKEAVEELAKEGAKLIITVDCGIADFLAVSLANKLGVDVIITDHHHFPEKIPEAYAIVNPKKEGCKYPEKMLCGAGVAFKLIQLILSKNRFGIKEGWEKWLLDMVGIATLSDMVPLTGENRILAHYGLKVLRKTPRVGLLKLFRKLGINQRFLTEDDIGFSISPRINAASRMDSPEDAFRLLATTDENEAEEMANHLDKINNERKGKVASIIKEVRHLISERRIIEERKIIVMGNPEWKPALLGLVANNIAEYFKRPVFLWGREGNNVLKGSCRSDGTVDLLCLMKFAPEKLFLQFGGHSFAGGFSVDYEKVHFLGEELDVAYEKAKSSEDRKLADEVDAVISLDEMTNELFSEIDKFSPFGTGNPKPVFLFEGVNPEKVEVFGKEKNHLKLVFKKKNGGLVNALKFFSKPENFPVLSEKNKPFNMVATLEKSYFMNRPELRLRIIDLF